RRSAAVGGERPQPSLGLTLEEQSPEGESLRRQGRRADKHGAGGARPRPSLGLKVQAAACCLAATASRMRSLARSPIMMAVALVLPCGMLGMIEASTTHRPSTPRSAQSGPTTASGSSARPIFAVPTGWYIGIVAART